MKCTDARLIKPQTAKSPNRTVKLAPKTQDLLADRANDLPIWIRAPKLGPEFWTGLTRPYLYQLAGENKIRSVSIREPGKLTGVRLFHLSSILAFIEKSEQEASIERETAQA